MVGERSGQVIRVLNRGGPANDWGVSLIAQGLSSPPIWLQFQILFLMYVKSVQKSMHDYSITLEGGGNIQIITILHNRRGTPKKDCIIHGPHLRLLILVKGGERESEKAQITRDDGFCPEGGAYNHQEHHQGAKLHLHAPAYNRQVLLIIPGISYYATFWLILSCSFCCISSIKLFCQQ